MWELNGLITEKQALERSNQKGLDLLIYGYIDLKQGYLQPKSTLRTEKVPPGSMRELPKRHGTHEAGT